MQDNLLLLACINLGKAIVIVLKWVDISQYQQNSFRLKIRNSWLYQQLKLDNQSMKQSSALTIPLFQLTQPAQPSVILNFYKANRQIIVCNDNYTQYTKKNTLFIIYPNLSPPSFITTNTFSISDLLQDDFDFQTSLAQLQNMQKKGIQNILNQISFANSIDYLIQKYSASQQNQDSSQLQELERQLVTTEVIYRNVRFYESLVSTLIIIMQKFVVLLILSPIHRMLELLVRYNITHLLFSSTRQQLAQKINSFKSQNSLLSKANSLKQVKYGETNNLLNFHLTHIRNWLLLNSQVQFYLIDQLMGIAFMIFLKLVSTQILTILHQILGYGLHITALESLIQWLMGLPAWFKLNSYLDNGLGNFTLFILNSWENITSQLTSFEPLIVLFLGLIGVFGFSLQLALIHDILIFCTLHIYAIYRAMAYFYHIVLEMVQTFVRLFRGKKYNVLKKRVDTQQFGINQFVLGMILFALFMFLLPTVAVYYSCFGAIFLSVHITEVLLLHLKIMYRSFPSFMYYWFTRYKLSIPCSIQMKNTNKELIIKIQGLEQSSSSYFSIMKRKLKQLWKIWKPDKVIVSVLKGQRVKYLQQSYMQNQ